MKRLMVASLIVVSLAGCTDSKTDGVTKGPSTAVAGRLREDLLQPLVMSQKPDKVLSVQEVLTRPEGETVIVTGKTPPDNVKPFNGAVAAFILMAPQDLDREEVKEEFTCEEAATCAQCRKILDQYSVKVEIVDKAGAILPTTLEGFQGLKAGSTITVEGEVKREGKDKKVVRIVAKRFIPG